MIPRLPFGRKKPKDTDFSDKYAAYLSSVKEIKSLQKSSIRQLDYIRKEAASAAALTVQLAHFHRESEGSRAVLALGQLHAEIERVQLASLEQLYEEEVQAAMELVLWKLPDVQENMKVRKKLINEHSTSVRKYEEKKVHLEQAQSGVLPKASLLGRRRKTEQEVADELLLRKLKLEQVESELEAVTKWLLEQFEEMAQSRKSGDILQRPVSALVACKFHITAHLSQNLGRILDLFPNSDKFTRELERYDLYRIKRLSSEQSEMKKANDKFGKELSTATPRVVCDCIAYLRAAGLRQEGLFRIPGDTDRVNIVKEAYDEGRDGVLDDVPLLEIHDVCTLLKMFFRKLPEPLIPLQHFQQLLTIVKQDMDGLNKDTVHSIVHTANHLPRPNRELFGFLMLFLNEVAQREDWNKMSASNLATCWAPSITRAAPETPVERLVADMHPTISFLKILIERAESLTFPSENAIRKNTRLHGVVGTLRGVIPEEVSTMQGSEEFF